MCFTEIKSKIRLTTIRGIPTDKGTPSVSDASSTIDSGTKSAVTTAMVLLTAWMMNVGQMLLMVVIGVIASGTMIIPGVSGSLVLMLLGYYKAVTGALKTVASGLVHFDFAALGQPLLMLIPFVLGIVLGIFGVAKLIEWLTSRYPTATYCGVLGLVVASPISLLIQTDMSGVTAVTIIISVATFAVGFIGAFLLAKGSKEA